LEQPYPKKQQIWNPLNQKALTEISERIKKYLDLSLLKPKEDGHAIHLKPPKFARRIFHKVV
jgi:hypothetical protein